MVFHLFGFLLLGCPSMRNPNFKGLPRNYSQPVLETRPPHHVCCVSGKLSVLPR